jgi:glycosyltransferase involved in cell wall biosynthesis
VAERVLQVVGPAAGGMARHVAELSSRLRAREWDVEVIDLSSLTRPLVRGADVVHAHGLTAGWRCGFVRHRAPLVVTVHNLVLPATHGLHRLWLRPLQQWLPRRADRVIAVSSEIERVLNAANVVTVWPMGPPPVPNRSPQQVRNEFGVSPDATMVVAMGRLNPQKGFDLLVDAVSRMSGDSWRLVIVGDGPQRAALASQIEAEGLGPRGQLVGSTSDPAGALAAADVVVCSSRWESGPLVVGEALWLERPVVSTAVGFVPELFGPESSLVPVDDIDALARTLQAAVANPEVDRAAVARARQRLDPEALTSAVEAVYRAMLSTR